LTEVGRTANGWHHRHRTLSALKFWFDASRCCLWHSRQRRASQVPVERRNGDRVVRLSLLEAPPLAASACTARQRPTLGPAAPRSADEPSGPSLRPPSETLNHRGYVNAGRHDHKPDPRIYSRSGHRTVAAVSGPRMVAALALSVCTGTPNDPIFADHALIKRNDERDLSRGGRQGHLPRTVVCFRARPWREKL
jgi:hypothetical protein